MNGYEALRKNAAWVDLSDHGKIRLTGEDRHRLLHAMTTNEIQKLEAGQGCYAFFLNAQGRILGDANIFNLGDSLLLDVEPELTTKLFQHLDKYIIADDVTLTDESSAWGVLAVEGPESEQAVMNMEAPVPHQPYSVLPWQDGFVAAVSGSGLPGYRFFVPLARKADLLTELQRIAIPEADAEAFRTVRLEQGKPRYGEDITERYLAQETNQMQAVFFGKGCYLGQEIVERVRSRAQIHRILMPVHVRAKTAPPSGAKLTAEGKEVGEITSAAFSPALGEVAALAYLRMEQANAKNEMTVSGDPSATAYMA
jgi:tRNA-modifying protein YgfZ